MLFNSFEFAIFLPVVFFGYWFFIARNLRMQNLFLIVASYTFYGWWDWRFLSLIAFSSSVDYLVGIGLSNTEDRKRRRALLLTSIIINLGFLGVFKYYNFFAENFVDAFTLFGKKLDVKRLNVILPVGISFYTFQTLSYSIDVYRKKFEPTRDIVAFFAFVSFFPQLVAGPIERAVNLLPQFYERRNFNFVEAVDGMRQILWGLFKKIVIADSCAVYANQIFGHSAEYSGSTLLLGALFFTFQIYGDFSGYSDIAIGTARLFGFNLLRNFAFPYFSRDIAEFWRRWHVSLSTWFRDYVYIPLGGSRGTTWINVRNTFIVFVVSGFWHGANWTFIAWGALNAIYFMPLLLLKKNRTHIEIVAQGKYLPSFFEFMKMALTFTLTVFAWIFFRAENLQQAGQIISHIFSASFFSGPEVFDKKLIFFLVFFLTVEWAGREGHFAVQRLDLKFPRVIRWAFYLLLIVCIDIYGGKQQEFIYFQF